MNSNDLEFTFAWEGEEAPPFQHMQVLSFRGREALSALYRYELSLAVLEPMPPIDPEAMIGKRATLRIKTQSEPPFRLIHGLIAEACEFLPVPKGMLYRISLLPPFAQAAVHKRSRVFLDKTPREIIDGLLSAYAGPQKEEEDAAVLPLPGNEGQYSPAKEAYAWRIRESAGIDDKKAKCIQHDESDWHFLSRLLEDEGIAYHFEQGEGRVLLVFSDMDAGRARLNPFQPLGPGIAGRALSSMRLGARFRANEGKEGETGAILERLGSETRYATAEGICRLLSAGAIFELEGMEPRYGGEYLVTELESQGEQPGILPPNAALPLDGVPYWVRIECARRGGLGKADESKFKPARVTPRPAIAEPLQKEPSQSALRNEFTGSSRTALVALNNNEVIGANESRAIGNNQAIAVGGHQSIDIGGEQSIAVAGPVEQSSMVSQLLRAPAQTLQADGEQSLQSSAFQVKAAASAKLETVLLELAASGAIKMEGAQLVIAGGPVTISGGDITINGGKVTIGAGAVGVQGATVGVVGGVIKLN